jgi:hypothetical protein
MMVTFLASAFQRAISEVCPKTGNEMPTHARIRRNFFIGATFGRAPAMNS